MSFVCGCESRYRSIWPVLSVFLRVAACSAVALATSIAVSFAGPCAPQIDAMQSRIDARLEAKAASGPSAQESLNATMSRQPTPNSIAAAEAKLHELSPQRISAVKKAMAQARAADAAGDIKACERALAKVQRVLRGGKS
jgi:hypothetical protein